MKKSIQYLLVFVFVISAFCMNLAPVNAGTTQCNGYSYGSATGSSPAVCVTAPDTITWYGTWGSLGWWTQMQQNETRTSSTINNVYFSITKTVCCSYNDGTAKIVNNNPFPIVAVSYRTDSGYKIPPDFFYDWVVPANSTKSFNVAEFNSAYSLRVGKRNSDTTPPVITASPPGGSYDSSQTVTLSANETSTIYYSKNGGSTWTTYSSPIVISTSTNLTFYGKDTAGNSSTQMTEVYTIDSAAPAVTISPPSGEFEESLSVVISSNEPGTIYYSVDGTEPSLVYSSSLMITQDTVVKAKAKDTAGNMSAVVSAIYTKRIIAPTLYFSPDSQNFDRPFSVTITANYPDASIYYSTDGSEPSKPYTAAIPISIDTVVKAKAVYRGVSSPVYEAVYTASPIQRTDTKFFKIPVSMPDVKKNAVDLIKTASPSMWMFALAFFGLLIFGVVKRVGRR
ncbi:chitobiase/beta-hexosaminidase C-terminal domain-containing protein [Brevibacillus sp. SYSU BS000544]|uniref:chitobiase/beta-hexosaminidase C-terminal domain-containing protein n=1 Tax=Brevibacillus sp. SYSU BS000544 TaxID=3416443 RepID=UPI003CE522B1